MVSSVKFKSKLIILILAQLTILLRSLVLECLVMFEDEGVLKEAKQRFQAHFDGTCLLPPDLCKVVSETICYSAGCSILGRV